jgi:hypothetical protein
VEYITVCQRFASEGNSTRFGLAGCTRQYHRGINRLLPTEGTVSAEKHEGNKYPLRFK